MELGGIGDAAGMRGANFDPRIIRRVLRFEVERASDFGGAAGRNVGPAFADDAAGKFTVVPAGERKLGLMVSWRGLDVKKQDGRAED